MRNLLLASVAILLSAVNCLAGDLIISANGFPVNHRGNGQFTLNQVVVNGKLCDCWTQNKDNDGWVASLSGGIMTVTYCRNGAPQAVYRRTGTDASTQTLPYATKTVDCSVPAFVQIQ